MTNKETDALVRRAELEIGQILKRLELETNRFVEEVDLRNGPIGCLANERQECLRHDNCAKHNPSQRYAKNVLAVLKDFKRTALQYGACG
jgi:hypothetical protein